MFEDVLASFGGNSQVKGKKFEHAIKWWLTNDPFWKSELNPSSVTLWNDSKFRNGPDIGIDLTAEDHQGNVWAIQVKNWESTKALPKSEIDKFLSTSNTKQFTHRLLITTTQQISANAIRAIEDQEKPCVVITRSQLIDSEIWDSFRDLDQPPLVQSKTLFPHQRDAVDSVVAGLRAGGRGQLLMACGSGKTITAQRIHEALESKLTLVLLPSLLLVQQTLQSWRRESETPFLALSVCSDTSVDGDESITRVADLPFPVTTDAGSIRHFLNLPGNKVIFSTYQSSLRIEEATADTEFVFDLIICDEAHRLAGKVDKSYGTVMRDGAIPSLRHLFMTATPKVFSSRIKKTAGEEEIEINSMDDVSKFGQVLHNFSFAQAIESGTLMDYRVVLMGVDDSMIHEMIENRDLLDFDGRVIDASSIAAHYGVAKAMQSYSIPRVISFHSRVAKAADFARLQPKIHQGLRPNTSVMADVISGKDSAFRRRLLLDKLRDLDGFDFGIIGNAKCLTEGVDVPSLDGVAFVDPRSSQVDIVQAVGRAIRRGGPEKKVGYIIVPVFFSGTEIDEETINESQFRPVWDVLNALKSHDSSLEEEINSLRRNLANPSSKPELPSRVVFDLPKTIPVAFASKIRTFLLEKTSSIWEAWFARLETFVEKNGHTRPKRESSDEEERAVAGWVMHQRHNFNKGKLPHDRAVKLEGIPNWTWDPMDDQWMEYFEKLVDYSEKYKTSRVPSTFKLEDGKPLGKWVAKLRGKKSSLGQERITLLENLPEWTWDPFYEAWETAFDEIKVLAEVRGNTSFSRTSKFQDGRSIGGWVIKQRQDREKLSAIQVISLESLPGWSWNPFEELRRTTMMELSQYVEEHGDALVPMKFESASGFSLGEVVGRIRQDERKGKLDPELKAFVLSLPSWSWHSKRDLWSSRFDLLHAFLKQHSRYPRKGEKFEGFSLGNWVTTQRRMLADGVLELSRIERLNSLPGWSWNTREQQWESAFEELKAFVSRNGGAKPSDKDKTNSGFRIGSWVYQQRKNWGKLSSHQQQRLLEFPWFTPLGQVPTADEKWSRNLAEVEDFTRSNGRLPRYRKKSSNSQLELKLGLWLQRQSAAFEELDARKQESLLSLTGFELPKSSDEQWEAKFSALVLEIRATGKIPPTRIGGSHNPTVAWLRRQRTTWSRLSVEQRNALVAIPEIRQFLGL